MTNSAALVRVILGLFVTGFGVVVVYCSYQLGVTFAGSASLPLIAIGLIFVAVGAVTTSTAFRRLNSN